MTDAEPYGHSIGRLERDFADFKIEGDGTEYSARRRGPDRNPVGPAVKSGTLDGLAAEMLQLRTGAAR